MAASTRTSTWIGLAPPIRVTTPSCSTRSTLAWAASDMSPISSRNSVPPSACSNLPGPIGDGAGERALHVAEQLALDQLGRDRGAVHLDEGAVAPGRGLVQRARHQLLAGAVLAGDEHPRRRRAHLARSARARLGARGSSRPSRYAAPGRFAQPCVLARELARGRARCAPSAAADRCRAASPGSRTRRAGWPRPRSRWCRVPRSSRPGPRGSSSRSRVSVSRPSRPAIFTSRNTRCGRNSVYRRDRLAAGRRDPHLEALVLEHLLEGLADAGFVVDDEDPMAHERGAP